jgi:hypothetical protein
MRVGEPSPQKKVTSLSCLPSNLLQTTDVVTVKRQRAKLAVERLVRAWNFTARGRC